MSSRESPRERRLQLGKALFAMSKYVIPEIPLSFSDCSFVSFQSFLVTLANRTKEFNFLYFYPCKTTQAMNVAVEWLKVLKIVAFSYVPYTH